MARIIKKSASENGEVVIKEPSKLKKAIKKIKPKHLIIAWDVIAACLIVTFTILMCVRFWPSKTTIKEKSTIELAIDKYLETADENNLVVEEILAEDLSTANVNEFDQVFVYAYNSDVENCTEYWEKNDEGAIKYVKKDDIDWSKSKEYGTDVTDYKKYNDAKKYKGQYKYDEDQKAYKISTGLYEINASVIINLIENSIKSTSTSDDLWNSKIYVIDLSKKSNRRQISKIGAYEASIDLTTDGLAQLLYAYNIERDKLTKIGGTTQTNVSFREGKYMNDLEANLHKYHINIYLSDEGDQIYQSFNLAYEDLLPITSSYPDTDITEKLYNVNDENKPYYDWTLKYISNNGEEVSSEVHPELSHKNVQYVNGVYEFNYYGIRK